ncbi:MAG: hypothetical protein AAGJ46_02395 [Planctomycetota bacterium]
MSTYTRMLASASIVLSLTACGCGTAESTADADDHGHEHDHEHGHRPASLHAAVAELTDIRDAISKAILEGDADAAHEPLHEAEELLGILPDVAAETDLPEAEWEVVSSETEKLKSSFAVIDKAFHTKDGDKQAAYEEVAAQLDAALDAIRSKLPMTGEDPDTEGHDHGEHDDDHDHSADEDGAKK